MIFEARKRRERLMAYCGLIGLQEDEGIQGLSHLQRVVEKRQV